MTEHAAQVMGAPSMCDLREEIDEIDEELLTLLNRRTELALLIGRIKHGQQLPVYVPERERAIVARLESLNTGPLPNSSIGQIFGAIMTQMREMEERLRN
jgi:chorismate mutase/prephenate dehydratase